MCPRSKSGVIEDTLRRAEGKLTEAARLDGMDNKNFSEKMKRHGVTLDAFKTNPPAWFRLCNQYFQVDRTRRFTFLQQLWLIRI